METRARWMSDSAAERARDCRCVAASGELRHAESGLAPRGEPRWIMNGRRRRSGPSCVQACVRPACNTKGGSMRSKKASRVASSPGIAATSPMNQSASRHGARPQAIDHVDLRAGHAAAAIPPAPAAGADGSASRIARSCSGSPRSMESAPGQVREIHCARRPEEAIRRVRACDTRAGERCAMPPQVGCGCEMRAACGASAACTRRSSG